MNKTSIIKALNRGKLKLLKKRPELLFIAGVVGFGITVYSACKATKEIDEVLEEPMERIERIHAKKEEAEEREEEFDNGAYRAEITSAYVHAGVEVAKLYIKPVLIGGLTIAALTGSHLELKATNAALASTCTALTVSRNNMAEKVKDILGEEAAAELLYDAKTTEVTELDEDNVVEKKNITLLNHDAEAYSPYAKFFDSSSREWTKDAEYNLMFLDQVETSANRLLRSRGHLFLNEVYDMLDIPRTQIGQKVGWLDDGVYDPDTKIVDFGIFRGNVERNRAFVNGYEPVILLDFNVDGDILSAI